MKQIIKISAEEMELINDLLNLTGEEIYQKYGYKRDETIIHTAKFPNGIEADIKLVICEEDTPYTEGVLFHNGFELTHTDPEDSYEGEWVFEHDGIEYIVIVETNPVQLEEIYDKVMEDYRNNDVMLNGLFFDFNVENIKKIDLIEVYKEIIYDVNGDYVIRVKNPVYDKDKEFIISGTEVELDDGSMDELYTGNMKDFLESLNDNDLGIVRLMEYEDGENGEISNGILLDFVAW